MDVPMGVLLVSSMIGSVLLSQLVLATTKATRIGMLAGVYVGNMNSVSTIAQSIREQWTRETRGAVYLAVSLSLVVAASATSRLTLVLLPVLLVYTAALGCYRRAHLAARALSISRRSASVLRHDLPWWTALVRCLPFVGTFIAWAASSPLVPQPARYAHALLASIVLIVQVIAASYRSAYVTRARESDTSSYARLTFWNYAKESLLRLAGAGVVGLLVTGAGAAFISVSESQSRMLIGAFTSGIVLTLFGLRWLLSRKFGQGGAFREQAGDGELSDPSLDNACWRSGLVYHNPRDARLWVERRVGVGVTLNHAHPWAWIIVVLGYGWVIVGGVAYVRYLL